MHPTLRSPHPSTRNQSAYLLSGRKGQAGVLLLEVLISILIFSFAFLGLVALQARAVQFSVDAEDRNRAALLANELVSTMWGQKSTDKGALATEIANWTTKVQKVDESGLPNASTTVSNADANGVVTITINWTPVGASSTPHSYLTQVVMP